MAPPSFKLSEMVNPTSRIPRLTASAIFTLSFIFYLTGHILYYTNGLSHNPPSDDMGGDGNWAEWMPFGFVRTYPPTPFLLSTSPDPFSISSHPTFYLTPRPRSKHPNTHPHSSSSPSSQPSSSFSKPSARPPSPCIWAGTSASTSSYAWHCSRSVFSAHRSRASYPCWIAVHM